jgi:hypothetical protein
MPCPSSRKDRILASSASDAAGRPISSTKERSMNRIVYLVGAVVIIIALLSFFGLR